MRNLIFPQVEQVSKKFEFFLFLKFFPAQLGFDFYSLGFHGRLYTLEGALVSKTFLIDTCSVILIVRIFQKVHSIWFTSFFKLNFPRDCWLDFCPRSFKGTFYRFRAGIKSEINCFDPSTKKLVVSFFKIVRSILLWVEYRSHVCLKLPLQFVL